MKILTHIIISLSFIFSALTLSAQNNQFSASDRQRWLSEIREYKHEFLIRDLNLSKEQQKEFFPLYDAMEDDIEKLNQETREIEIRMQDNPDASDLDIENNARTIFEQKRAEGQIEMTYFDKFKTVLTPRQLLKLKSAERKFTQQLVNHHRRMKGPKKKD